MSGAPVGGGALSEREAFVAVVNGCAATLYEAFSTRAGTEAREALGWLATMAVALRDDDWPTAADALTRTGSVLHRVQGPG